MIVQKYKDMLSGKSVIRQLSEFATARGAEIGYENVFDYSLGNPSVPVPQEFTDKMIQMLQTESSNTLHGYSPSLGITKVREAIAESLKKRFGIPYTANHIFMASGAAGALAHAFRLVTEPGDEILTFAPFFPEYNPYVNLTGAVLKIVPANTADFQINFEAFEEMISPKTMAVLINTPNNPSGIVYSKETLEKLAAVLTAKSEEYGHDIFVISDEPYREIVFAGVDAPCVSAFYDNTIMCYSFSKSLSLPGERIGYVLVPDCVTDHKDVYAAVVGAGRSLGYINAPSLFQRVIAECCGMTSDISIYENNAKLLVNSLREMGYECVQPQGAFYLFLKALEPDDKAFSLKAREFDLLLVPGFGFGAPGWLRLAFCVQPDMIQRAMPKFKELADSYKK